MFWSNSGVLYTYNDTKESVGLIFGTEPTILVKSEDLNVGWA